MYKLAAFIYKPRSIAIMFWHNSFFKCIGTHYRYCQAFFPARVNVNDHGPSDWPSTEICGWALSPCLALEGTERLKGPPSATRVESVRVSRSKAWAIGSSWRSTLGRGTWDVQNMINTSGTWDVPL